MPPRPLPAIAEIEPYKGGESTLPGFAKPIKLASNENPLGSSPKAREAVRAAAESLHLYPDGAAAALRTAIGALHGLEPARIICGAGSDEIFQLVGRAYLAAGDEIVQSQYGFLVYRLVAQQAGAATLSAPDRDFHADVDGMLARVGPRTRVVFLANPNNPTGTVLPASEVARLHAGLPEDVLLVLDGAYSEYLGADDHDGALALARAHPNVLVTRTFSKIYGLAALRLGWAYGAPETIEALNKVRGPFNVSAPALAAGVAAIEDQGFVAESRAHNASELARVSGVLAQLGFRPTPSVCNFVLTHFADRPGWRAADCDAFLRSRGFIARMLGAYGLPNALRLSIGTAQENDGVLAALTDFAGRG